MATNGHKTYGYYCPGIGVDGSTAKAVLYFEATKKKHTYTNTAFWLPFPVLF